MPNAFDQFDEQASNPFDEFDAAPARTAAPTVGDRFNEGVRDIGARFADSASRLGRRFQVGTVRPLAGAQQAAGELLTALNPLSAYTQLVREDQRDRFEEEVLLGAPTLAREGAAITAEAQADQQRLAAANQRPSSIMDALTNPGNALEYYGGIVADSLAPTLAAVATRNPTAATALMGVGTGATEYGASRAEGRAPLEAAGDAGIAAILEAGLGKLPFEQAFQPGLRRLVTTPLAEAGTEAATELAQGGIETVRKGTEYDPVEQALGALDAAIAGGVTGAGEAVLGGGKAPAKPDTSAQDYQNDLRAAQREFDDLMRADKDPTKWGERVQAMANKHGVEPADITGPTVQEAAQEATQGAPGAESATDTPEPAEAPSAPEKPRITAAEYAEYLRQQESSPEQVAAPAPDQRTGERRRFEQPAAADRREFERRATEAGLELTPEQVDRVAPPPADDAVTGLYDGRQGGREATIERAQQHVLDTREPAVYVVGDIANLGGLNKHYKDRQSDADIDFRAMADIFKQEVTALGGDVVPMRTGGDEMGAVVVGVPQADVDLAASRARSRIEEYVQARGLDNIPNPKGGAPGVSLHFGSTAIVPGVPTKQIKDLADDGINLSKEERQNVGTRANETAGNGTPDAGTAGSRVQAQDRGVPEDRRPVERASGSPRSTGTRNEVADAEREAEGRDPVIRDAEVSNEKSLAKARDSLTKNPSRGREVVDRLQRDGARNISLEDEAVLLVEKVRLRNARDAAAARASDPKASDVAREAAATEWNDIEAQINALDQATYASGAEWGRLGQFRQRMLRDDYTFEALERKERVLKGRPLTAEESVVVKREADAIAKKQEVADAAQAKVDASIEGQQVTAVYDQLVADMAAGLQGVKRRPTLAKLKTWADESRAALAKMESVPSRKGQSGAIIDPQAFFHLSRIGAYHIANGAAKFADWVAAMRKDLGDRLFSDTEESMEAVHRASTAIHEAGQKGGKPTKAIADILAGIEDGKPTQRDVYDLARAHVLAGVKGADAVMEAVHADLEPVVDGITERDVRRLFTNYGQARAPSRDADREALREMRQLVRMQEDIDRLQEGMEPLKTGRSREKRSQEVMKKRSQLIALLIEREQQKGLSPERIAAYQALREEMLRRQIADLERRIETGEERKPKIPKPKNAEIIRLETLRDRLKAELTELEKGPKLTPEQRYQRNRSRHIQREIGKVQARIKAGDYARSVRTPKTLDEANTKAQYELQLAKEEFARRQFEWLMDQRPALAKIWGGTKETMNLARAIMTSLDLSAVLRQGGFITLGHPIRGIKSFPAMMKAAVSGKGEFDEAQKLLKRPNAPLYKRAGLELTEGGGHTLSKMEEQFQSRLVDKLPKAIGGGFIRGSQRAFVTFLNKLRADTFDAMVATLPKTGAPTDAELKAIANYINVATGRGKLGVKGQSAGEALNTVFFAPRLVASRFNLLAGQPLYGGTARTRKLILQDYARFLMGVSAVIALGALTHDEEDGEFIELDPRSSNFGKMRFGNTYIDPLAGLAQVTVLTSRILTGEKRTASGKLVPLRDKYRYSDLLDEAPEYKKGVGFGGDDTFDIVARFLRTKFAPIPGAITNIATGKNVVGQETDPADELVGLVTPMSFGNVKDVMEEHGFGPGAAITMLELLGMGVQYRDPKPAKEDQPTKERPQ